MGRLAIKRAGLGPGPLRHLPGTRADDAWAEVEKCVRDAGAGRSTVVGSPSRPTFDTVLTRGRFYADGYVLERSAAEELLERTHREVFGAELTGASPLLAISMVALSLTATARLWSTGASENIHGFDEGRASIESVRRCTKSMALFIAEWVRHRRIVRHIGLATLTGRLHMLPLAWKFPCQDKASPSRCGV